jgi:hypothetical protein
MNKLFLIFSLVIFAGKLGAQPIATNELTVKENPLLESAPIPSAPELPSYHVRFTQSKTSMSFEVISPKSGKADLKLVSSSWGDICTIHKGIIHAGKNIFTLRSSKIGSGTYYVVSKLGNGEQFADKIVVPGVK